tara:strand:- start:5180 stop:5734 length:555 start_codon:yes stop_codon:yes gene_type:complete
MKNKNYQETLEIPEGMEVKIDKYIVNIKGPKGEVKKELKNKQVIVETKDNKIIIKTPLMTKREKKIIYTFKAHLKNMIKGVQEKFVYKLKICSGHFPMNVSINNKQIMVKNFLGEKVPRVLKIKEGAEVKMDGDMITIKSCSKEIAGQIAADLEILTSIKNRDNRIYQDGIYIINKAGKSMDQN